MPKSYRLRQKSDIPAIPPRSSRHRDFLLDNFDKLTMKKAGDIMRKLLSQAEIEALFPAEFSDDVSLNGSCETNQGTTASCGQIGTGDLSARTSMPTCASHGEKSILLDRDQGISADFASFDAPPVPIRALQLSAMLHGSLTLDEILRGCCLALKGWFSPVRLGFVKICGASSTAVVYSMDGDGTSPPVGPIVVSLESAALRECILKRREQIVRRAQLSKLDTAEKHWLHDLDCTAVTIIYWPVVTGNKLKGVLGVALPDTERLNRFRASLLSSLAGHLAIATERAERYQVESQRSRQCEFMSQIARQAGRSEDINEFVRETCRMLSESSYYDVAQMWIMMSDRLRLTGCAGSLSAEESAGQQIPAAVEECYQRGEIVWNQQEYSACGTEARKGNLCRLAVPIGGKGYALGVLYVGGNSPETFAPENLCAIEGIASLIDSSLRNLRTLESAKKSNDYLQAILKSAKHQAILSTDIHGYVLGGSVGSQRVFQLSNQDILGRDVLTLFTDPHVRRGLAFCIRYQSASYLERYEVPQERDNTTAYLDITFNAVNDTDGRHIGYLCVVQDVSERVYLRQRLEALAITDDVTGLYNRRGFIRAVEAEVERSRRNGYSFALCFLDLDGLKRFNDTYGHIRGGRVIQETAVVLQRLLRPSVDVCCRYGGDEYVVLMPQMSKLEARSQMERIRVELGEHFAGQITASFGIAESSDADSGADALLAKADEAMYQAKARGKNCVVVYQD
jgi:diguanylate cyclase (GGDEF)-like protein/PAS domain S-box-containing protein